MSQSLKTKFLLLLLQVNGVNPYHLSVNGNEWSGKNDELLGMIKRFYEDNPAVLPFRNNQKETFWFLFAHKDYLLGQHIRELDHFLLPYHCTPLNDGRKLNFDSEKRLGRIGYELFPDGYYAYVSKVEQEENIWGRLRLWRRLDDRRPNISYDELKVNAFTLRSRFYQAIVLQKWEEAKSYLNTLQQGKYLSDENYKFLTLHWLSAQGKWDRIWESDDFEILAGFGKIPIQVHIALIRTFYQRKLSKSDILGRYDLSMKAFKESRYKLGTLLRSQLSLDEETSIRVFAYEAASKGQEDKLERYQEKTKDEITKDIIEFLLLYVQTNKEKPIISINDKLERAKQCFTNHEYEDAFLLLNGVDLSIDKVRLLAGISIMEETEETCSVALKHYEMLSEQEQRQLMKEPQSKGWMIYLLNLQKGNESLLITAETTDRVDWYNWFYNFIHTSDFDLLEEHLTTIDVQQGNINWSITSLSNLSEIIATIGIEALSSMQKSLLQTALPMFVTELMQDDYFPNEKANELYEYTREILCIHGKRNENNTGFLLRLTEGLLCLEISKVHLYWNQVESWFNVFPTDRLSSYVLESLELFKEYGLGDDLLQPVWTNWVGSLLDRIANQTVIQSWIDLGNRISANSSMIDALNEKITSNRDMDLLEVLPNMSITIYSLREKPAQRAAQRITKRNPNVKVKVCTDSKLTNEAKAYARNSDLVILVTTCMSHALTFGISPYLDDNLLYSRSSGETGIIEALEEYCQEQYDNQVMSSHVS
ncbi:protein DpdD [Peribacillus simplex]|uniref:protein DpdD n=1 Tax=Peribacillus simplex TaxID=1478 RepID=UPI0024C1F94D|nr:protein DpdD [Peribacillus simplex]WHY58650.1 protein DpdD [Peribacillus simplex]